LIDFVKIPWRIFFQGRCLLICVCLAIAGCKQKESASAPGNADASSGNPLTAPVDYLGAVSKAQKSSIKTLDLVQVNQAIQLFHEQEERFPRDLQELVSKGYLRAIPNAPYKMKYEYNPNTGQVRVVAE
jgi:hypothetical protein